MATVLAATEKRYTVDEWLEFEKTAGNDSRNCWFRCLSLTNKKQPGVQTPTAVEVKKHRQRCVFLKNPRYTITGRLKDLADVDELEKQKKKK